MEDQQLKEIVSKVYGSIASNDQKDHSAARRVAEAFGYSVCLFHSQQSQNAIQLI